ncbi:MAG: RsfS/YbeB/iojap family protein, partial [Deltaproteobacteria bacterium]
MAKYGVKTGCPNTHIPKRVCSVLSSQFFLVFGSNLAFAEKCICIFSNNRNAVKEDFILTSKKKALEIARLASEKKAFGITILEIKKLSSIADYLVICSADSERQT